MYRIKARVHVVFTHVEAFVSVAEFGPIFMPLYALAWLIAPRSLPRPPEALGEYDAFLLKCEIEDLQDEMRRRVEKRKRKHVI